MTVFCVYSVIDQPQNRDKWWTVKSVHHLQNYTLLGHSPPASRVGPAILPFASLVDTLQQREWNHTLYVVFVFSMSRSWFLLRHASTELSVDKKFRFFNRELSKANLYQFDSCRFKAKVSISIFDYLAVEINKKNHTQKRLYKRMSTGPRD